MMVAARPEGLSTLVERYSQSKRGNGGVTVVTGPVATGRTTLLRAFAELAAADGAVQLSAVASRAESNLPLAVISQLLGSLEELSTPSAEALALPREFTEPTTADTPVGPSTEQISMPLLHGLREVLLKLSRKAPVVICVDDVQHCDGASLQCLLYIVRRLRSTRIMVVLAECCCPRPAESVYLSEILRQPDCVRIALSPLSTGEVAELLGEQLGSSAKELAPQVHAASGGNLLLIRALIDDYLAAAPAHGRVVFGEAAKRSVQSCLYHFGPDMVALVQAVAVLGSADPRMIGELAGLTAKVTAEALATLDVPGIFLAGRFQSTDARDAVLAAIPAHRRSDLHRRAAATLYAQGSPTPEVVTHLLEAADVEDGWAARLLYETAEQALMIDDVDMALRCLRLAYRGQASDDKVKPLVRAALTRVEWNLDPSSAARYLPELASDIRAGLLSSREALTAVHLLLWQGAVESAMELLRLIEEQAAPDPAELAVVTNTRILIRYLYPGSTTEDLPHSGFAVAASTLCEILAGDRENAIAKVEQILQKSRLDNAQWVPTTAAVSTLIHIDELDRAAFWCDHFLSGPAHATRPAWHSIFRAIRSVVDLRQGNLRAAEENAVKSLDGINQQSWGVGIGVPLATIITALTMMGRYRDVETYLKIPVPNAMFRTPWGALYREARGIYHLAMEQPRAALLELEICGEQMKRWDLDLTTLVPWRLGAAQAHLKLGDAAAAEQLVLEELAQLPEGNLRTRGITLRILAATREPAERLTLLGEAIEDLRSRGSRLEMAFAIGDLGLAHKALGNDDEARILMHRSRDMAESCGVPAAIRRVNDDAGVVGDLMASFLCLSEAEQRVGMLAAEGLTNRQIAKKLFITTSTVEQHLTRVYRKLKIKHRNELRSLRLLDVTGLAERNDVR